ncbi:GntP family permease [Ornithinimicrobium faecis]|uniref:GntP family permease n=1 Tax=Ornithinimicrobium faecis TaxID=2934158 RepID=A0ABY4YX55_9MICO|nr:GntP family permease [Ornithinimicrobium sp. HY1793]USQ81231.1 GntP family permease [Ornithinimicrobium sp. HY1793]
MVNDWIVLHVAISALIVIGLILVGRLDPTISLIVGSIYLGLTGGLGFAGTVETIGAGFGDTMAELGLLIGFGTLLGQLLVMTGTLSWLVQALLRLTGERRFPYALGVTLGTVFPSVYADVVFLLAAPVVRAGAQGDTERRLPRLATGMIIGTLVGLALVVPGLAAVAIAGIFAVPLGTMLLYGLVLGPATILISTAICTRVVAAIWRADRDVEPDHEFGREDSADAVDHGDDHGVGHSGDTGAATSTGGSTVTTKPDTGQRHGLMVLSVVLPVSLIATATIVQAVTGSTPPVLGLLGSPMVALLIGALLAYVVARLGTGHALVNQNVGEAFARAGNILLVTGAGGAFGTVVASTSIADVLGDWFSGTSATNTFVLILLAWAIAAVVHLMIGSISVAAITAAGIVSPLIATLGVPTVIIALAVGAGSLFVVHVNSNGFWMIRSLLGVTTNGAFKVLSFTSAVASVVALFLVLCISVVV